MTDLDTLERLARAESDAGFRRSSISHDEIISLIERIRELEKAGEILLEVCDHGDFKNGNTDQHGGSDEGEHLAYSMISRAKSLLEG